MTNKQITYRSLAADCDAVRTVIEPQGYEFADVMQLHCSECAPDGQVSRYHKFARSTPDPVVDDRPADTED